MKKHLLLLSIIMLAAIFYGQKVMEIKMNRFKRESRKLHIQQKSNIEAYICLELKHPKLFIVLKCLSNKQQKAK